MTDIVDQAVETLMSLPKPERDRIAYEIIERIEDKNEWDRIVFSPVSQKWLAKAADKTLKQYARQEQRLTYHLISLPSEEYLREDSYWKAYDDLPEEIRKLAESNYQLWKKSPSDPSLRFRQVHETLPIFSFRVGLQHRTVGVQTADEKIAWFWVGSFSQYRELIANAEAAA